MRIVPYNGPSNIEDVLGLYIIIKPIPFEDTFAPAVVIVSPDDNYQIQLDELNCLMDGIEIAQEKISEIINFIIHTKTFGFGEQEE